MSRSARIGDACCNFIVTLTLFITYLIILGVVITRPFESTDDDDHEDIKNHQILTTASHDGNDTSNDKFINISFAYDKKHVDTRTASFRDANQACNFFDACELVQFELKSSEGKNALLNGLDPALKYSLRSRAWTDADVTRWNARFLQPKASISVRAPLIYASETFSAYYMYTHTDLKRFSVATVRADAPHHVIRGYVPEAIDSALQIKLVPDAPPSRVLQASPFWKENIDDIHAYDDRISWYVKMDSANYSFEVGGRVKADKALVINFESLNNAYVELGIDDTFGAHLTMRKTLFTRTYAVGH
eukprot:gene24673-30022_t